MNTLPEIPPEVIHAARLLENWMKENGHERWELFGLCSRNFVDLLELERARSLQWRRAACACGDALRDCMGHVYGEHRHWQIGFKVLESLKTLVEKTDKLS